MELPLIGRKTVDLDLTVILKTGASDTSITAVDVGLSPAGGDSSTVVTWYTVPVALMVATFDLIGFYCPLVTGAGVKLIVPVIGADLWARLTASPEIDAEMVDHIRPY
jgi:hypothetical protein